MQWVENRTWGSLCVTVSMKLKTTMCEPCKCVISLLQVAIGNILKPTGMLYNAVLV